MPIWPFKKRRRSPAKDAASQPLVAGSEKAQSEHTARAATYPPSGPTVPATIPRKSSKRVTLRKRRASQDEIEKRPGSAGKENVPPPRHRRKGSCEDITALPMSYKLEHSPHLRPIDTEKPHIAYNFRPYSSSQSSIQREHGVGTPPRPRTLRSKRSGYDNGTPSRRHSSRKRKDDHIREEEIRAMSARMPIPKRPGEGPLRRDSKKMRGIGMKDSNVSLPAEASVYSNMSSTIEQRGWEIGGFDIFNPRPAVRLSGTPQYVTSNSVPPRSPTSPEAPKKEKERARDRKRETIGARADDLDASEIRMLLERDTKRREQRKKEQQEKLDRKLRSRGGRNRGDSDKKKREREEEGRKAEEDRQRAEEEEARRIPPVMTPPTAIHPAFRDRPAGDEEAVGLGIDDQATAGTIETAPQQQQRDIAASESSPDNPFLDPSPEQVATPMSEPTDSLPGTFTPVETAMEEPVIATAQAVRMSQANTPPLSPVHSPRAATSLSQMSGTERSSAAPTPPPRSDLRRQSDPKAGRVGPWASIFRRGGTNVRTAHEPRQVPSEASFSNTSRESMRNQPLPAHLVDTSTQVQSLRRKSGTPVRTQSKFREDLPEMPISPPESPDVTTAVAAAAAARRSQKSAADVPRQTSIAEATSQEFNRNDTPVSPSLREQRVLSSSLASVDSEGSWLASGKRTSTQSGLAQRRREFTGSYEELGTDKDAEHFTRGVPSAENQRVFQEPQLGGSTLDPPTESESEYYSAQQRLSTEDDEDEDEGDEDENDEDEDTTEVINPGDPMTVHESVRRQPTLVHRDPRVVSREGLLSGYTADPESPSTPIPTSAGTGKGSMELGSDSDPEEHHMERATSVSYGTKSQHARQISAGSARLLDVPARRASADIHGDTSGSIGSKL